MTRARDLANVADDVSTGTVVTTASPSLGRRNIIINGGFDVWQRGTSFTVSNGAFNADRWSLSNVGSGGAGSVSQQSFTVGQTDVPGEPTYFLRYSQTTAGGEARDKVYHKVEDVRTGAGQTVTLSFWAKANATKTFAIRYAQAFGSGGSATVSTDAVTYTATTSWQKFTFTETLPSISGKTIGSGNYVGVSLCRELSNFSTYDIDIAQVQLEVGSVATPFEHRSYGEELLACQRYTFVLNGEKSVNDWPIAMVHWYNSNYARGIIYFPVVMRTGPTLIETQGNNYYRVLTAGSSYYTTNLVSTLVKPFATGIYSNQFNSNPTLGYAGELLIENSAATIVFDAEL